eukprot:2573442-Rhodomonas_salina.2
MGQVAEHGEFSVKCAEAYHLYGAALCLVCSRAPQKTKQKNSKRKQTHAIATSFVVASCVPRRAAKMSARETAL